MLSNKPYYPILEAEISRNGIRKKDIAKRLNVTPRAFSDKLTGKVGFWWEEAKIIHSIFPDIPVEKLFEHSEEVKPCC